MSWRARLIEGCLAAGLATIALLVAGLGVATLVAIAVVGVSAVSCVLEWSTRRRRRRHGRKPARKRRN